MAIVGLLGDLDKAAKAWRVDCTMKLFIGMNEHTVRPKAYKCCRDVSGKGIMRLGLAGQGVSRRIFD